MAKWLVSAVVVLSVASAAQSPEPLWDTGTFSILGYDPATGEVGGAVQSRVFSVGNGVLWADASVGVAATQAIVDVSYGAQALELLRRGVAPAAIVKEIWEKDPDPLPENWTKQGRQFAVMNLKGEYAAFTGPKATEWAGHKSGKFTTAQGNILAGPAVVSHMVEAFERQLGEKLTIEVDPARVGWRQPIRVSIRSNERIDLPFVFSTTVVISASAVARGELER